MTYKIGTEAYQKQYYLDHKDEILARSKKRWDEKREEIADQRKSAYADDKNYTRYMLDRCRGRAKTRGLECTITRDDIVIPERCPILGIPLQRNKGKGVASANSPSVDRIDSSRGYVPGNVWVISYKANAMKNNATPDELLAFARWAIKAYDSEEGTDARSSSGEGDTGVRA